VIWLELTGTTLRDFARYEIPRLNRALPVPETNHITVMWREDYLWECFLVSAMSTDSARISNAVAISAWVRKSEMFIICNLFYQKEKRV